MVQEIKSRREAEERVLIRRTKINKDLGWK